METNIFKYAVINKLRFPYRGQIATEDINDLSVEELDGIFKNLNSQKKLKSEESLLKKETKTKAERDLEVKIEIVKAIVEDKLKASEERKNAIAKKAEKEKILRILAQKEDEVLLDKTPEELRAIAESL